MLPRRYGDNIDGVFNQAVTSLIPIGRVVALFACVNVAVTSLFGVESVEALFFASVSALFPLASATLGSGLLYLLMNNVMWFFGIHGGNMLDAVAQSVFVPGTAANAAALAAGGEPVQIVTKTFLDVFASIGGAGALLSLLVAILLFGRRRNVRRLSAFAALPMVFNVSEIMMFGLPVVWNPVLFVPFIVVPLVNMVIAYAAMAVGLVPPVIMDVSWTTPPVVGGYLATGSVAGAVLQLACIVLGALSTCRFFGGTNAWPPNARTTSTAPSWPCAWKPSVPDSTSSSPRCRARSARWRRRLPRTCASRWSSARSPALPAAVRRGGAGRGGRGAAALRASAVRLVYPPLVIELAQETGALDALERAVFECALDDAVRMEALAHAGAVRPAFSVSINATARLLQDEEGVQFVIDGVRSRGLDAGRVVVEATEREALRWDEGASALLERVVDAGIPLAIDDFSMGRTSFQYLETSVFTVVKLDGTIAKGVLANERYADIVSSITHLRASSASPCWRNTWRPPSSATCSSAWDAPSSRGTCTPAPCRSTRWRNGCARSARGSAQRARRFRLRAKAIPS